MLQRVKSASFLIKFLEVMYLIFLSFSGYHCSKLAREKKRESLALVSLTVKCIDSRQKMCSTRENKSGEIERTVDVYQIRRPILLHGRASPRYSVEWTIRSKRQLRLKIFHRRIFNTRLHSVLFAFRKPGFQWFLAKKEGKSAVSFGWNIYC